VTGRGRGSAAGAAFPGERAQQMTKPAGRPRLAAGRGHHGDVAGPHDLASRGGGRRHQGVVFCRPHRLEPARRQVGRRADAEVGPVHVRMRPVAELVLRGEDSRGMRRVLGPVRDGDRAEHHVPALAGVAELAAQPAGRHDGVGVGGGQPDRRRVGGSRPPQQLGHAGGAGRAHVAGPDGDDRGAVGGRHRGRRVGTGVGHDQQVDRHVGRTGRCFQRGQAGGQIFFLVVGRHHDTCRDHPRPAGLTGRLGHARPVA